jgi:hypothetical protein
MLTGAKLAAIIDVCERGCQCRKLGFSKGCSVQHCLGYSIGNTAGLRVIASKAGSNRGREAYCPQLSQG